MLPEFGEFRSEAKGAVVTHGQTIIAVALAISVLLVGAVGGVTAHDNVPAEPGASGYCDNEDGDGGSFAVHGPGDHANNFAGPAEAQSAAHALLFFGETQGECGSDDRYLEVHVISAQSNVQYCYSEASDGDEGDDGHGDEATDPVTAGAGIGEVTVNDGSRNHPPGHSENDNDACEYNGHNSSE